MDITIDLTVLLAIVLFFRLRSSDQPRSSASVQATAVLVLIFGLLLAGTETGKVLLSGVGSMVALLN